MDLKRLWPILLLISFAYELPFLKFSGIDRFNLRLFDVCFILGLFIFGNKIFRPAKNLIVKIWEYIVLWMIVCVTCYFLINPVMYSFFSAFYLWKYIEGLLVVRMFFLCKDYITIKDIQNIFIWVGLFIALYSIPQYMNKDFFQIELAEGHPIIYPPGTILGPYNTTYFALAQIVPICSLFTLFKIIEARGIIRVIAYGLLFLFISFPALCCGSRTALVFWFFSLIGLLIYKKKILEIIILCVFGFISLTAISFYQNLSLEQFLLKNSYTLSRSQELEDSNESSSVRQRVLMGATYELSKYDNSVLLPILGGGFYVAPIEGKYRVGYGAHNNYVFALEQMGIVGLALFLYFLFKFLVLAKRNKSNMIALIMVSYIFSLLFVGFSGQTFWRGFGNGNINTLLILLMALSLEKINYKYEDRNN